MTAPSASLWPGRIRIVRIPGSRTHVKFDLRVVVVTALLFVVAIGIGLWSLSLGYQSYPFSTIIGAVFGQGDPAQTDPIVQWRLPRIVIAILGGAALAVSGALFQSVTRNPLGSPDIIGFTSGAYTGALVSIIVVGEGTVSVTGGALIGGLLTGALMYVLAFDRRSRGISGYRFIIVGVGVAAALQAVNSYLIINSGLQAAISAATWGAGSLDLTDWGDTIPVGVTLLALLPVAAVLSTRMGLLELGDDSAAGLGVNVGSTRLLLLGIGVVLLSVVTAVVGPIAFIALAAPQIAKRLTGSPNIGVVSSAAMGAALLVLCDAIARIVIAPQQLPAGVVSLCLGGGYLVWLLIFGRRRTR